MAPINSTSSSSPPAPKRARTEQTPLTNFFKSYPKAPSQEKADKSSNNDDNDNNVSNKKKQDDAKLEQDTEHPSATHDNTKAAPGVTDKTSASGASESSPHIDVDPIIPHALQPPIPVTSSSRWEVYEKACLVRTCCHNKDEAPRTKVAGLDMDGTLFTWRVAAGGWASRMEHYELWNCKVITKLRQLYDEQHYQLVIFSNQGAIRGAFDGKKATFVKSLIEWLAVIIDRPLTAILATNKKLGYHKPSANMWAVAEQFCNTGGVGTFDVANSFFVGDSVGGDDDPQGGVDVGFAQNVGALAAASNSVNDLSESSSLPVSLQFYTPTIFFGPSSQEERSKFLPAEGYEAPSEQVLKTRAALTGGYLEGPILLLLCGAQGSGKSTFCEQLVPRHDNNSNNTNEKDSHWVHLSQDTISKTGKPGKREQVEKAASLALLAGKSVVIDRMHLDKAQRAHFVNVAEAEEQVLDVPVHVVVLTPPKDILAERVLHRQNHPVKGESGARMAVASAGMLQLPSYKEGIHLWSATSTVEGAARLVQLYRSVGVTLSSANDSEGEVVKTTAIPDNWSVTNGRTMPTIALGTMGLGRKTATEVVSLALKLGFTAFDTAPTYKNEDKVGEVMKTDGDDSDASFCILKVPKRATTPDLVRSEFIKSLSKLGRKTANLLLLHWPCDVIAGGTLKEVWKEMEQLVHEGLVHMIGVCNFSAQALGMLLPHCIIQPVVNQVERHPLLPQWDLLDFCHKKDIQLQAHSPLGQGSSDLLEHTVVQQVAVKHKCSPAQVVLRWNLQQGVAVVPKCSSEEHMKQARSVLGSDSCQLSPADMRALNDVGETKRFVAPPFMYGTGPYCWGKHAPK